MRALSLLPIGIVASLVLADAPRLTQPEAEAAVAEVLPDLQVIRGLRFKTPVPVTVIDDAKARAYALSRVKRMTPESKIRADETVFHLLGIVPETTDVLKTLLDVLEEQAGGFYDPGSRSFYLLDDMPKDMTALLTAHEMTHALEDQRYDIDGRLMKILDDDDASFALSAVAEGSATAASAVYVAHAIAEGKIDAARAGAMSETLKTDRLNAMPPALRRELLGPYILGMSFLLRGHVERLQKGFPKDDVDAAWARPPKSSEQILHPEKYWDPAQRDEPKPVTIRDPQKVLGPGFKRSGFGVLGELTIGSLLGAPAPDASELAEGSAAAWTNAAATGWGGDRFELWTKGDSSVVLLATVWDTEKDAAEFAAALAGKPKLAFRREGVHVGIVAGAPPDKRDALLQLLAHP